MLGSLLLFQRVIRVLEDTVVVRVSSSDDPSGHVDLRTFLSRFGWFVAFCLAAWLVVWLGGLFEKRVSEADRKHTEWVDGMKEHEDDEFMGFSDFSRKVVEERVRNREDRKGKG